MQRKFHPVAALFQLLEGAEFDDFVADIKVHGVRVPIWIYKNRIIDGRNRWLACEKLGIECPTRQYTGKESELLGLVVSMNLKRRHLSESQRAMVAAGMANFGHGGNRKSDQGLNIALETAAEMVNVSRASAAMAKKVRDNAEPEVVEAVKSGKLAVSAAARLADQPKDVQHRVVEKIKDGTAKSAVDAVRLIRYEDTAKAPPLPAGKYRLIYCDCPWDYGSIGLQNYGAAAFHYPTLTIEQLCDLDIADRAIDDSVLFMWVPVPMLEKSFRVIASWRFEYKTGFVWNKLRHNFGHYVSARHEHLLICTRGSCLPDSPKLFNSVQTIERSPRHSAKPEEFRKIIDAMYPPKGRDRLELFPREKPPGLWDYWGNEVKPMLEVA